MSFELLIAVIIIALVFEYINGFHDAANAIATVVSTKVLTPRVAIIYGAIFNIFGAFFGTHVAKTIGEGIVHTVSIDQVVILCALLGAIIWNLITWYYGIPSSSSHALIGGLIGASVGKVGFDVVNVSGFLHKVIYPMVTSPAIGFISGFLLMIILLWMFVRSTPERVNKYFKKLQIVSSGILAFSHGSNDAQKTMGVITMALVSYYSLDTFKVPLWVILSCAITMGLGTMFGGWKIIQTMGNKVFKLEPIHGFAAQVSGAGVILTCTHFGIPISTTHVISCSIMGVGSTKRFSAVRWGVIEHIVLAWIITIPMCFVFSHILYLLITNITKLF